VEDAVTKTIRARFKGGVLEPMEDIDLPEGEEVTFTIMKEPSAEDVEAFRRAAGSWRGKVDADELIRGIYADRLISTRPTPEL
jgi:predicted DNA-binding antitoxin AbrB/MazE fold protein